MSRTGRRMIRGPVGAAGLGAVAVAMCCGGLPAGGAAAADAPPAVTRLFPAGAAAGATVTVRAAGTWPRWPVRVWTDRPGTEWTPLEESGSFQVEVPADGAFGIHRVRFYDDHAASAVRRFVVGTDPDVLEVEPNDRLVEAQRVSTLPATIHGVLEKAGDVDGFTVDLEAGQTLVASLDAHEGLRSPVDAVLELVDPRAAYLARNLDARGLDPRIVHTASRTGPVTVRVYGFPADPNQTIGLAGGSDYVYRLMLTTGPAVAAAVPAAAVAGQATLVEAVGWNLPNSATLRELRPPPGVDRAWVTFDGVSGVLQIPVVDAAIATMGGVDAGDASPAAGETAPEPSPAAGETAPEPAPAVAPPVVFSGWFDTPGRRTQGRIVAAKDAALVISVEAHVLGSEADTILDIVDSAGAVVLSNAARDASISWTPPADGEYALVVRERQGAAGPGHFFRLVVAPSRPELRATTGADAIVATAEGTVDVVIAVERLRGWQEPVEFFLSDPPPGITATAVTSAADGATAKQVTLTIAAAAAWSGPLSIAARHLPAAGETAQAPGTIATVACGPERLPVMWLTVRANDPAPQDSGQGPSPP
jgi:hypothetical protein